MTTVNADKATWTLAEVLDSKARSLEGLADALAEEVNNGNVASGHDALAFVQTYARAVRSMVPEAETIKASEYRTEYRNTPGPRPGNDDAPVY